MAAGCNLSAVRYANLTPRRSTATYEFRAAMSPSSTQASLPLPLPLECRRLMTEIHPCGRAVRVGVGAGVASDSDTGCH